MSTDTQLVELAGRHWLIGHLLTFGLEVAEPVRDRGVDLIVYQERNDQFRALPVQVKAASQGNFGIHRKYDKTKDLLLAYVWDVRAEEKTTAFVLTVAEAIAVAEKMEYTKTASWTAKGKYTTTKPGKALTELLRPFSSTENRWRDLLRGKRTPHV